jgi:hypothetical protein
MGKVARYRRPSVIEPLQKPGGVLRRRETTRVRLSPANWNILNSAALAVAARAIFPSR